MKTLKLFSVFVLSLIVTQVFAQDQSSTFNFELNAGPSFTLQDVGGTNLKTGVGFEALFHYRFMPHLGVYGGWGWNRFGSDDLFEGVDADFEETGYVFGLQFKHPINQSPMSWFVRGGGLYNHIEIENADGDIIEDTGHGLGFHAAAGIDIPFSDSWSITPSVLFHSLSRDAKTDGGSTTLDLTYLGGRLGIVKSF